MMTFSTVRAGLLAFALVGCGQSPSQLREAGGAANFLVAVMGGNVSCGSGSSPLKMGLFAPFESLRKNLEASGDYHVDYFLSCHNSDAAVHFVSSDNPGEIQATDLAGAAAKIDDLYAANDDKHLILAGHSYGGWLAMKTAPVLSHDLDALITIDPISRELCSIFKPQGCTQAPADITHEQRLEIKEHAAYWLNFWQTRTFYLHASAIPEADANVKEEVEHTQIDSLADVWEHIASAVQNVPRS